MDIRSNLKNGIKANILAFALLASSCGTTLADARNKSEDAVLKLNAQLFQSMIVEKDGTLFTQTAVPDFRVLAPGGVIEGKAQALRGIAAWDVESIEISRVDVTYYGNIAIVTNRLDIDGTMQPVGRWGPLKSMRVFVNENDEWRLVSHALTPCLPKAVEVGRC